MPVDTPAGLACANPELPTSELVLGTSPNMIKLVPPELHVPGLRADTWRTGPVPLLFGPAQSFYTGLNCVPQKIRPRSSCRNLPMGLLQK